MNTIISQIKAIINENINTYLPDQKREAFEENGAIYYMNGKNGTEFDWFVNERLSDFFVFYNDEESLGAVKLNLYHNGDVAVYIYDEQGHHMKKEVHTHIKTSEELLLKFAVLLKKTVDDPCVWDADIEKIDTEKEVSEEWMRDFEDHKVHYAGMIERRAMFGKRCFVSKKLLEEGWKVGYMTRSEPLGEEDSGWCFMVGNEDDAYTNDYHNIALLYIGEICQIDPDVMAHICHPVGTALIRVSSDTLEIDENKKPIFLEKRQEY